MKAYEEIIDFIAAGTTPHRAIAYQPSEAAKARVGDLIHQEKTTGLTPAEKSELELCLQLEHIMRLAKARAQQFISHQTSAIAWPRIDAMTDEMIDTSDIPPLSDDFFEKADLRLPKQRQIYKKEKKQRHFQ
jgi:hypothetical protein